MLGARTSSLRHGHNHQTLGISMLDRTYRVVPLEILFAPHIDMDHMAARSDFEALEKAKSQLGPNLSFALWEGDRHVLTYQPVGARRLPPRRSLPA